MFVADTSAFVSLATVSVLETVLGEYVVHTTETVRSELADTAVYDDTAADAATAALEFESRFTVHDVEDPLRSSRIDAGEGSCAVLVREESADVLLTDDLRALPELDAAVDAQVALSPLVLRALVKRGVLDREVARSKVETLAKRRDWLGAPIYRRALALFDDE